MLVARMSTIFQSPRTLSVDRGLWSLVPSHTHTLLLVCRTKIGTWASEWVSFAVLLELRACEYKHTYYIKDEFQRPVPQLGRWERCPESMLQADRLEAGNILPPSELTSSYQHTSGLRFCPVTGPTRSWSQGN